METQNKISNSFKKYWAFLVAMFTTILANAESISGNGTWYTNWWVWVIIAAVAIWLFTRTGRRHHHPH
jgi:hypothetical protein